MTEQAAAPVENDNKTVVKLQRAIEWHELQAKRLETDAALHRQQADGTRKLIERMTSNRKLIERMTKTTSRNRS